VTFHVKHGPDPVDRALEWLQASLTAQARSQLEDYVEWLEAEGLDAGGIGPRESARLWDRHIADSLCFAGAFGGSFPGCVLDVGSGVGLPGIPLAVAFPHTRVVLLDRSGRRCHLLRRVIRILGLANAEVVESDVADVEPEFPGMTLRASLPPPAAMATAKRLLEPGGVAVLGLSRTKEPDEAVLQAAAVPTNLTVRVVAVPPDVLDSPAWLLRMTPQ
jgi:16S rRNA (guanine527-N7)-methyltransferase